MKIAFTAVILAAFCATGLGQTRAKVGGVQISAPSSQQPFRFAPPGRGSFIGLSGAPFSHEGHHRGFGRNAFFYGELPYFPPDYEESYHPEAAPPAPMPQTVTVVQPRQEPAPGAALLELQGNQWVKVTSFSMANLSGAPAAAPLSPAKELPPAILVYRDGHSEELSSYSIIGNTLYTKSDYWTSGAWTRKIQIADLDLPATIKENHERGINFDLPSGPDEMILRP